MKKELKPCCYCNDKAVIRMSEGMTFVQCMDCLAKTQMSPTRIIAEERWNTNDYYIPTDMKKVDIITTDNSIANLLEKNKRLKNEITNLKESLELARTLKEIDWEQRRYEIAKDIIANGAGEETYITAKTAIEYADELINQLKQQSDENKN